tara:strand:+ start:979 stop:1347 length:369 start_codon:yes stop_codon:yes gene_type:complete
MLPPTIPKRDSLPDMDIHSALSERPYYNKYSRKFEHYYDVYHTNVEKIDSIIISSLKKGYQPQEVLVTLDRVWSECIQREDDYRGPNGDPLNSHKAAFELYLRNVLRKILVFDAFDRIFSEI